MARPRKTSPRYLKHKQSGRARAVWTDESGHQRERLLPGAYDSKESRAAFHRLALEMEAAPHQGTSKRPDLRMVELLNAYRKHAERHYRDSEGKTTGEYREHKLVMAALRQLYGRTPVAEFGPLKLKATRQQWVSARLSRSECNRRTNIVRRIFRWGVAEELIEASTLHALEAVAGLQRGKTTARETAPIQAVEDAVVDATIPHLNRYVRGLVELQRLTGCRPSEACIIRRADIDTSGTIWNYRPRQHKTAHKGKTRVIAIGPRGQDILREYFTTDLNAYLFSARKAVEEHHASRTRETPKFPSHIAANERKRTRHAKRPPAEHYNAMSYAHAVARACDAAWPPPAPLAKHDKETAAEWKARLTPAQKKELTAWRKAHRWSPNQLRHAYATRVRREFDLEAAQIMLGHSRADVTQIYAEKNQALAAEVAAKIG